jgi:predicted RNase H-like HicB family nuclease
MDMWDFVRSSTLPVRGDTIEAARKNLQEAVELFFETAGASEIDRRRHAEVFVTRLEVEVG